MTLGELFLTYRRIKIKNISKKRGFGNNTEASLLYEWIVN